MGIESNKEAVAMMKNALGSIENRFREAYNKGYKDGLRDGASQVTAKLVSKILEEAEAEPQTMVYPQVDGITPSVIEPQTDCAWGKCDD